LNLICARSDCDTFREQNSFTADGVIGAWAATNRGRLLLSGCENVVDVNRHKHREGAAMRYFAGRDVSLEDTAICVVDAAGRVVKEGRAASEPEALCDALRKVDLPLERIGLEACSLTAWLHDGLCAGGLPARGWFEMNCVV
jgi:hypothetical protein